jgi:hypothetical protein
MFVTSSSPNLYFIQNIRSIFWYRVTWQLLIQSPELSRAHSVAIWCTTAEHRGALDRYRTASLFRHEANYICNKHRSNWSTYHWAQGNWFFKDHEFNNRLPILRTSFYMLGKPNTDRPCARSPNQRGPICIWNTFLFSFGVQSVDWQKSKTRSSEKNSRRLLSLKCLSLYFGASEKCKLTIEFSDPFLYINRDSGCVSGVLSAEQMLHCVQRNMLLCAWWLTCI